MNRCVPILLVSLLLLAGCEADSVPNLPATTSGGGFSGSTWIAYPPALASPVPNMTLQGNWLSDCAPSQGTPAASAQPWTEPSNSEFTVLVINGRTCASWNSHGSDTKQISWGKFGHLPCTDAESTFRALIDVDFAASRPLVRH